MEQELKDSLINIINRIENSNNFDNIQLSELLESKEKLFTISNPSEIEIWRKSEILGKMLCEKGLTQEEFAGNIKLIIIKFRDSNYDLSAINIDNIYNAIKENNRIDKFLANNIFNKQS